MRRERKIWVTISILALLIPFLGARPASALSTGGCNVSVTSTPGVVLVDSGGFCYLAFSATGANSFTIPTGVTSAEVVVIAGGGGGGGGAWGGGGGAGGIVVANSYSLTPGATMNLSVGAGGAGGAASLTPASNRASNGSNSWINTSTSFFAQGGGAGAGYAYGSSTTSEYYGASGGSGGGATENGSGGTGGTSTQALPSGANSKYGNVGGNTAAGGYISGGGGGGAGGAGVSSTSSGVGGAGGAGTNAFASWFTAIGQFGVGGYIAGGGGGGAGTTAGAGGSGGGGIGGGNTNWPGTNAIANTGSGGGGASYTNAATIGGNGGSGLIVFKFVAFVNPAVIYSPSTSTPIRKGLITAISVSTDSPGKIRFLADGKRISGCLAVSTSGSSPTYTATCNWRATVTGFHRLSAILTPTNTNQSSQSSPTTTILVGKRSTTR